MDLGLSGKRVIMNGGAHGLGLASAKLFAEEGAHVAFMSRDQAKIDAATSEIAAHGTQVHGTAVDMVGSPDSYRAWLGTARDALGGCDIFVHLASSSGMGATGDWQRGLDVDILGAVTAVEVLGEALEASGSGSIVLMSSTAALETFIAPQAFNALKAALITYGAQLSQALAPKGVRVNTVSPGAIAYPGGNWEAIRTMMPPLYEGTLAQMPMGRFGEPDEVARAIVFVASPACPYMTGSNIVIDGGFTKRVQF